LYFAACLDYGFSSDYIFGLLDLSAAILLKPSISKGARILLLLMI
jgi:hypothetical protein